MLEQSKYILEQKNILPVNNDELVTELLKQNNEFKELLLEQKNTIIPANNDELVTSRRMAK